MIDFIVTIPARLGSTRLPEKVLREIAGKPLIQYVHEAAIRAGASEVIIATDHERVRAACAAFRADVVMTSPDHISGTDRINEVASKRGWPAEQIVVNVQGDEPLMPPELISQCVETLASDPIADIATLCHRINSLEDWLNPNVVKVVCRADLHAHYFSRAPIPWQRDGSESTPKRLPDAGAFRHIGIYSYRAAALRQFSALSPAPTEGSEALEQLRALWHGMEIAVGEALVQPPHGVDTEADLQAVAQLIEQRARRR